MADVEVARIEVSLRQRLQMLIFQREALFWRLSELAKLPLISHINHPLLELLVNMGEAVELAVPDEEVLLKIFHHSFHLAFGSDPTRAVGAWQEVIVVDNHPDTEGDTSKYRTLILMEGNIWKCVR